MTILATEAGLQEIHSQLVELHKQDENVWERSHLFAWFEDCVTNFEENGEMACEISPHNTRSGHVEWIRLSDDAFQVTDDL